MVRAFLYVLQANAIIRFKTERITFFIKFYIFLGYGEIMRQIHRWRMIGLQTAVVFLGDYL